MFIYAVLIAVALVALALMPPGLLPSRGICRAIRYRTRRLRR
ncbi:hypothetical protein [Paracraurococcus lichenis]|uniref:Uncharacterized protein n=1 Tax=Paracraurococcus lichenis TaxID=3064888 RepID=A0ABT9EBK0_9PROT|nr:hypothetical protein [Paracraurococcus sp. LOR1-02]MDO9713590.1 hypothetical protein [Paracraurococcus sp. LOR1-02]